MPVFRDERRVRHNAVQMFDLVADVERYPEFVPLCKALRVRGRRPEMDGRETLVADMTVGYKLIRETFTSRVALDKPNLKLRVEYIDGPFSRLENIWTFKDEAEDDGSRVGFFIDYEFKSRTLGMLMGSMFDAAFRKFASAFEQRADAVYGRSLRTALRRPYRYCFGAGAGIGLFGSPLIAPARGASLCGAGPCVCSATSVRESGLMTIMIELPCASFARTIKDAGMMVMSVKPAFVRSSCSFWLICAGTRVRSGLGRVHRRERRAGKSGAEEEDKQGPGSSIHRSHLQNRPPSSQ